MDSNTFQLTCPICGRVDIGSYQGHLQTHSKQALIDTLINQHQILSPNHNDSVKRGIDPEFVSLNPHRTTVEDGDPSVIVPSGSTRRCGGLSLRHSQVRSSRTSHSKRTSNHNPLEIIETTEVLTTATSLLEEEQPLASSIRCLSFEVNADENYAANENYQERLIFNLEIRNAGVEEPHIMRTENSIQTYPFTLPTNPLSDIQLADEVENEQEVEVPNIQFDEEQVLELVSEAAGDISVGTLYLRESDEKKHDRRELEIASTLALNITQIPKSDGISHSNFIKYIVDETGSRQVVDAEPGVKWIFPDGVAVPVYSSFQQVPSSSQKPTGSTRVKSPTEEDSSLSNSKGHGSARHHNHASHTSDMDLMTDEEIPPRGEISEYEESNTSSLLSEDSKHGLISSSLGSMFSNRVRRLSPVIDHDSFSSRSKAKKGRSKSSSMKSSSLPVTSSFTIPEGHRCPECAHEQYFSTIFELAQHHAEIHQKPFNSSIKKREEVHTELGHGGLVKLNWLDNCHKPISQGQIQTGTTTIKEARKNIYKRKEFCCLYCEFSTFDKKSLAAHVSDQHTGKFLDPNQFECTTCGKMFNARNNLVKHLLIHRGKRHACGTCNKAFTSQFKLMEHYRVHTKDYPFGCTQCERTFRTPSLRTAHVKRVHEGIKITKPKLEFYCTICHRVLHSKAGLFSHTKTHNETVSKCPFCQESFPKSSILVRHIRISHDATFEAKESKECPVCLKMFHPNSMKSHLRIHKGEKPFPCPVCSMTFRTYANLSSHSWSHTNIDKPFKCKKCPKSYLFKKYLDSHMIVHKRRTSHFTCNECGVKFTSKMNMKRHIEEHYKEKKYSCKVCGKCFHRKYYLSEHERIHSNIKPFSCSICGKTSTTKSNHRSHVKIHDARESGTLEG